MELEGGWFRVYRTEFSEHDWLWGEKRERTKWEAWMDLINMAAFKAHEILYDGSVISVKRGEVPTSERKLAERWAWSRGKIRRFLTLLEACSRIVRKPAHISAHGLTLITICNYRAFQGDEPTDRPTDGTTESPRKAQTEEGKEGKEGFRPEKSKRKHSRPTGWRPTDRHGEKAVSEGVDLEREADKFRHHHDAKGSRFASWDQAFHSWLLKAGDFARRDSRSARAGPTPSRAPREEL